MASRRSAVTSQRLSKQTALVTGGTQGIGLAIARALLEEGCEVVVTGRTQEKLDRAVKELANKRAAPMICDIRDPRSVRALFAALKRRFGRLDILINNAGIGQVSKNIAELPLDSWNEVIGTNLTGTFLVTQAALPLMRSGSAIVSNLSIAAKEVFPGSAAYCASKHGALGFTNTLREELRPRKIRVIALLPGATDTAIWQAVWPDAPRKKMMSPEAVATAVVNALAIPENATIEELVIRPSVGVL